MAARRARFGGQFAAGDLAGGAQPDDAPPRSRCPVADRLVTGAEHQVGQVDAGPYAEHPDCRSAHRACGRPPRAGPRPGRPGAPGSCRPTARHRCARAAPAARAAAAIAATGWMAPVSLLACMIETSAVAGRQAPARPRPGRRGTRRRRRATASRTPRLQEATDFGDRRVLHGRDDQLTPARSRARLAPRR